MSIQINTEYQPRRVTLVSPTVSQEWHLKTYWLSTDDDEPDPDFVEAARREALSSLSNKPGYGVGFLLVHHGRTANWVIAWWWTDEDILRRLVWEWNGSVMIDRNTEHVAGCVWELGIVDWERKAWINRILKRVGSPDLGSYMQLAYPARYC